VASFKENLYEKELTGIRQVTCSQTFLLAGLFGLRKITMGLNVLAQVNI